jgi:hypothetical protein
MYFHDNQYGSDDDYAFEISRSVVMRRSVGKEAPNVVGSRYVESIAFDSQPGVKFEPQH